YTPQFIVSQPLLQVAHVHLPVDLFWQESYGPRLQRGVFIGQLSGNFLELNRSIILRLVDQWFAVDQGQLSSSDFFRKLPGVVEHIGRIRKLRNEKIDMSTANPRQNRPKDHLKSYVPMNNGEVDIQVIGRCGVARRLVNDRS